MSRFRILSLDGGGIRGAFSAAVLAQLEHSTRLAIADHFDLITGTSTGGIIALGLGLGLPAERICEFYRERGPRIFPSVGLVRRFRDNALHLLMPKRSADVLAAELREVFGERLLGESRCRLVLPAYDTTAGRIYLLKTAHHPRFDREHRALAVDCALATSAAPTYFQASPFPLHRVSYVDGGIWANCPALVGVTEAIHFLGVQPEDIDLLSIGTTTQPFSVSQRRRRGGVLAWNKGLIEILMQGQAEAARAHAELILGAGGTFHRIDCTVEPGRFSLDDSRNVTDLIGLGSGEGSKKEHLDAVVRPRFLNGTPAAPFVPVHPL